MAVYGSSTYGSSTYGSGGSVLTAPAGFDLDAAPFVPFVPGELVTAPAGFDLDAALVVIGAPASAPSETVVAPAGFELDAQPAVTLTASGAPSIPHAPRNVLRHAHVMPALSAASPKYQGDVDYTIDRTQLGQVRVFVGGQDVTFLRGIPLAGLRYAIEQPLGARDASFRLPCMDPWDELGEGDLWMIREDAPVEVAMVTDGTIRHLWEGYLAAYDESSSEAGEDYALEAEGVFMQATHWPWDPPVVQEPEDPAVLVARALNSVPHRRWHKIPETPSGLEPIEYRGEGGNQSTWQYAADILADSIDASGRQLTLERVGPYRYRVVLKRPTTAEDFTVTKGAPGVEVRLRQDFSTRKDALFARGFAKDGGFWCNRFFPGLKFGNPPQYPMANPAVTLTLGTTDGDTSTGSGVSTWQRRMRFLGYPVTVDGVINTRDVLWIREIQKRRGILVDGILGPQTWTATFEDNNTEADLTTRRLPMARKDGSAPHLYTGSGAIAGRNPDDDPSMIVHAMPEYDAGTQVAKSAFKTKAERILARDSVAAWTGTVTLKTDPHEDGSSRYDIEPGRNLLIVGHYGGVVVQVTEAEHYDDESVFTVDSRARDAAIVDAIINGNFSALRDRAGRNERADRTTLNDTRVVQYESESQAGFVSRTAVNGNSGLWSVRKIYVSQTGVAKIDLRSSGPRAEMVTAVFSRPITANRLASFVPDPLADTEGWYDAIDTLEEKYGLEEVFGTPGSPGGYWPHQKSDAGATLNGRQRDTGGSTYSSEYGGFMWVAMFTSRSTWVEGRIFPAIPT